MPCCRWVLDVMWLVLQSVFKESLLRVFKKFPAEAPMDGGHLQMGFAATLEVRHTHTDLRSTPPQTDGPACPPSVLLLTRPPSPLLVQVLTSREFKVSGAIGPCSSLRKAAPNVAEIEIGQGGTNQWSMGGIDPATTIAVYFEVTNPANNALPPTKRRFIQVGTTYHHHDTGMQQAGPTLRPSVPPLLPLPPIFAAHVPPPPPPCPWPSAVHHAVPALERPLPPPRHHVSGHVAQRPQRPGAGGALLRPGGRLRARHTHRRAPHRQGWHRRLASCEAAEAGWLADRWC